MMWLYSGFIWVYFLSSIEDNVFKVQLLKERESGFPQDKRRLKCSEITLHGFKINKMNIFYFLLDQISLIFSIYISTSISHGINMLCPDFKSAPLINGAAPTFNLKLGHPFINGANLKIVQMEALAPTLNLTIISIQY